MQSSEPEWRLHIGAHKTGTTHFQDTLEVLRASLHQHDLDYIPREEFRAAKVLRDTVKSRWLLVFGRGAMYRRWRALLRPVTHGAGRIAISEENFLGGSQHLFTWPFYQEAEKRLRALQCLGRSSKLQIFVSIRSFDELLPSAYAEILRYRPLPHDFRQIRERALSEPPSWSELIGRVQAVLPQAKLTVWTFDDYRKSPFGVMSRFCGVPIAGDASVPIPTATQTPTAEAISEIERLPPDLPLPQYETCACSIIQSFASGEKFAPFSSAERQLLRSAYDADVRELQERFPGVLMTLD